MRVVPVDDGDASLARVWMVMVVMVLMGNGRVVIMVQSSWSCEERCGPGVDDRGATVRIAIDSICTVSNHRCMDEPRMRVMMMSSGKPRRTARSSCIVSTWVVVYWRRLHHIRWLIDHDHFGSPLFRGRLRLLLL